MSAAVIDSKVLNSLFENQKRLDDVFDSIFADDSYFISSVCASQSESHCSTYDESPSFMPAPSRMRESQLTIKVQRPYFFVLPIVLEIAGIYFLVVNLL